MVPSGGWRGQGRAGNELSRLHAQGLSRASALTLPSQVDGAVWTGQSHPSPGRTTRPPTAAHWGSHMTLLLSPASATIFSFLLFSASFFLLPPIRPHAGSRPECGKSGMTAKGLPESESCAPACAVLPRPLLFPFLILSWLLVLFHGFIHFSPLFLVSFPLPLLPCMSGTFFLVHSIHSANSDVGASTGRDTDCGAIRHGLCSKRVVDPAMLSPHPRPSAQNSAWHAVSTQ